MSTSLSTLAKLSAKEVPTRMVKLACPGRASVLADNFVITKKKKSFSCIVDYSMILSELVQNKIIQTDIFTT